MVPAVNVLDNPRALRAAPFVKKGNLAINASSLRGGNRDARQRVPLVFLALVTRTISRIDKDNRFHETHHHHARSGSDQQ